MGWLGPTPLVLGWLGPDPLGAPLNAQRYHEAPLPHRDYSGPNGAAAHERRFFLHPAPGPLPDNAEIASNYMFIHD